MEAENRGANEIDAALQTALGEPGDILTDWVVIAEFIGPDDNRRLAKFRCPGSTEWRMRGMLHEALFKEWEQVGEGDE